MTQVTIDAERFVRVPRQLLPSAMLMSGTAAAERVRRTLDTPYPPASAPYTPPHRRSGRLRASVHAEVTEDSGGVTLRIVADAVSRRGRPYPEYLEWGTRRMAPRPFLRTAYEQQRAGMVARITDALRAGLAALGFRR